VLQRLERFLQVEGPLRKEGEDKESLIFGEDAKGYEEPFEPFADLCKRRFLWYYQTYLQSIEDARKEHGSAVKDGEKFKSMPFEGSSNGMEGKFDYTKITERLEAVRKAIDDETARWERAGKRALDRESPTALAFQNTFKHLVADYKRDNIPVDFELVDNNPFTWRLVLFGRPMTNLDGAILKVKVVFSQDFPQEQPRAIVETPLFHQRVTTDGVLCYFPKKPAEINSHIEGIVEAIEQESPRYDPRTLVNLEASKLLWGDDASKKIYNRKLRRSAQESSE